MNISGNYTLEEELESLEKTLRSDKLHPVVLVVMLENLGIIMENYKDNDNVQIKINELLDLVETSSFAFKEGILGESEN